MEKKIVSCYRCAQKLRVPATGALEVKCPKCAFSWRTDIDEQANANEDVFKQKLEDIVFDELPKDGALKIAVIGKVSTGKSSLINALFQRDKSDPIASVGALSGVTTTVSYYKLEDDVFVCDSPGLNDIKSENSDVTKEFLKDIDLGIFVVEGSSDASQKQSFDELKAAVKNHVVVINKFDIYDRLNETGRQNVLNQWKNALGVETIYPTVTIGYDPDDTGAIELRGIEELRDAIFQMLKKTKKDLLLARQLKDKSKYATGIITAAVAAVAVEAFVPGSALYITTTQGVAIASLNFLYQGKQLDKSSILALLPTFAAQNIGTNAFLWIKSFLPPTGVVDAAAAAVASTITFGMLSAVKYVLERGYDLSEKQMLVEQFTRFKKDYSARKLVA